MPLGFKRRLKILLSVLSKSFIALAVFGLVLVLAGELKFQDLSSGEESEAWHLDYADSFRDNEYRYEYTGSGVNVYVIDAGIDAEHPDFEGRAQVIFTDTHVQVKNADSPDADSHGTHVSGIIVGKTTGIAKKARLFMLRVFGSNSTTDEDSIVRALDFLDSRLSDTELAVLNLSLGPQLENRQAFTQSKKIAERLNRLTQRFDIPIVMAAGNDRSQMCSKQASTTHNAFVVGATTKENKIADFSNLGDCVTIVAPGEAIKSTIASSSKKFGVYSGTSQAAPYVTGIIAQHLEFFGKRVPFSQLNAALQSNSVEVHDSSILNVKRVYRIPLSPMTKENFEISKQRSVALIEEKNKAFLQKVIVLGAITVLLLLSFFLILCTMRRRKNKKRKLEKLPRFKKPQYSTSSRSGGAKRFSGFQNANSSF